MRSELRLDRSGASQQIGMEQPQDLPDDPIQIYRAPCSLALAHEIVNPVNNIARSPGISRNIREQLVKHFEFGGILRQKTSPGCRVAGNGGEGLIKFVHERSS